MSIADTATGTTAHDRPFWRADYARFARAIRRTRHTRDGLTAKSAEHQARCDELAGVVAALFRADAPGAFSGESSALAPRSLARCPATGTARTTPRNGATPIRQPAPAAGTNKTSPPPSASRTAENRPPGIHGMHRSGRPRNGTKRAQLAKQAVPRTVPPAWTLSAICP